MHGATIKIIYQNSLSEGRVFLCGLTDRQTDLTKLTVDFRNFEKAPKNLQHYQIKLYTCAPPPGFLPSLVVCINTRAGTGIRKNLLKVLFNKRAILLLRIFLFQYQLERTKCR